MHIADDTLVLAGGADWVEAKQKAVLGTAYIVNAIKHLGLRVAPAKTEAIYFYRRRRGKPPNTTIPVDGVTVQVGE